MAASSSAAAGCSAPPESAPLFQSLSPSQGLLSQALVPPRLRYGREVVEAATGAQKPKDPIDAVRIRAAVSREQSIFDPKGRMPDLSTFIPRYYSSRSQLEIEQRARSQVAQSNYFQCKASLDKDVSLPAADHELVETLAVLSKVTRLVDGISTSGDAFRLAAGFAKDRGAPFVWRSSPTLASGAVVPIYRTSDLREHAIMLAWRVAILSIRAAAESADMCSDGRGILSLIDTDVVGDKDALKRKMSAAESYLLYALCMLHQVIPAQMEAKAGSLGRWALLPCALAVPEMRPDVLSAFCKLVCALCHMCVCTRAMSHRIKGSASELPYLATVQDQTRKRMDSDRRAAAISERVLCSKAVETMVSFQSIGAVNRVRSMMFMQFADALRQLEDAAWGAHLDDCLRELGPGSDRRRDGAGRVYASSIHKSMEQWIRTVDKVYDEEAAEEIYASCLPARQLRNFLFGSAVYMECLMMAYRLSSSCEWGDDRALVIMSVLARKTEMLLAPVTGRRRCGIELMVWLIVQANDHKQFSDIVHRCVFEKNQSIIDTGLRLSSAPYYLGRPTDWFEAVVEKSLGALARRGEGYDAYDDDAPVEKSVAKKAADFGSSFSTAFVTSIFGRSLSESPADRAPADWHTGLTPKETRLNPLTDDDLDTWIRLVGSIQHAIGAEPIPEDDSDGAEAITVSEEAKSEPLHDFSVVEPRGWIPEQLCSEFSKRLSLHLREVQDRERAMFGPRK